MSQETYERLKDDFVLEDCGEIEVRGKGRMRTWFLVEQGVGGDRTRCLQRSGSALQACGRRAHKARIGVLLKEIDFQH